MQEKVCKAYKRFLQWGDNHNTAFVAILISLLSIIVYRSVIFGNHYYIYGYYDIACDSIKQTVPMLINKINNMFANGLLSGWSYEAGLGADLSTTLNDPFNFLLALIATKNTLPYLMGIFQCFKVTLAGVLFYLYLRKIGCSRYSATVFGICYAFCGNIIARGAWVSYPNECICAALLLLAFEDFLINRNKWKLPLAYAFLIICLKSFYSVLYFGILVAYAIFRYSVIKDFKWKDFLDFLAKLLFLMIVGILLAAVVIVPDLYMQFGGARSEGSVKQGIAFPWDFPTRLWHSKKYILQAVLLCFGWDVLPIKGDSRVGEMAGRLDVLSAPLFYCGILGILLLTQTFTKESTKNKVIYSIVYIATIIAVCSRYFMYLATGLQYKYTFKLGYFWITILILYLASHNFDKLLAYRKLNKISIVILVVSICLVFFFSPENYNYFALGRAIILLIIYAIILFGLSKSNNEIYKKALLAVIIVEVLMSAWNITYERDLIKKDEWNALAYNDASQDAIDYIKSIDQSKPYRIDKQQIYYSLCDSMAQGYFGTQSYLPGNLHSKEIIEFIDALEIPRLAKVLVDGSPNANYIYGFDNMNYLNTFLGVKYIVNYNMEAETFGYQKIDNITGAAIYQNLYSVPLGMTFDTYITNEEFEKLDVLQKRKILLETCILEEAPTKTNISKWQSDNEDKAEFKVIPRENYTLVAGGVELAANENSYSTAGNDGLEIIIDSEMVDASKMLVFTMEFESDRDNYARLFWSNAEDLELNYSTSMPVFLMEGKNTFRFDIPFAGVSKVFFQGALDLELHNLEVAYVDEQEYYAEYISMVEARNKEALEIVDFSQDRIVGKVNNENDKFLLLTIPYNKGWKAKVDGLAKDLMIPDIGFMGIELPAGEHDIILWHEAIGIRMGILLTIIGLIIYGLLIIKTKERKNEER